MHSTTTQWHDELSNRTIEFEVCWQDTEQGVRIDELIPTRVVIHNQDGSSRLIGVHSDSGRQHLNNILQEDSIQSGITDGLTSEMSTGMLPIRVPGVPTNEIDSRQISNALVTD